MLRDRRFSTYEIIMDKKLYKRKIVICHKHYAYVRCMYKEDTYDCEICGDVVNIKFCLIHHLKVTVTCSPKCQEVHNFIPQQ